MSFEDKVGAGRRKHVRGTGECELYHNGQRYSLIDWSVGGCAVSQGLSGVTAEARIEVELVVFGPATRLSQKVTARVVRVESGMTALEFQGLDTDERDLLLIAQGAFSKNLFILSGDDDDDPLGSLT